MAADPNSFLLCFILFERGRGSKGGGAGKEEEGVGRCSEGAVR